MANIYDYLMWRSDLSFEKDPVHEPDILIFAALSYTDLSVLQSEALTIEEVNKRYVAAGIVQSTLIFEPSRLLRMCAESDRYKDVLVENCSCKVDPDQVLQFCAVGFRYGENKVVVAYQGTDTSLAGWQEDLYFSAVDVTKAQKLAVEYLFEYYGKTDDELILAGHSKGGNLVQYALANVDEGLQERIEMAWSLDGPGFRSDFVKSEAFAKMAKKMTRIVPEQSFVGMLMENPVEPVVIKSDALLTAQHLPDTWQIMGIHFERASLSAFSMFVHQSVKKWLDNMSDEEKLHFIDNVFAMMASGGAETLDDMVNKPLKSSRAMISTLIRMDKSTQQKLGDVVGKLLNASGGTIFENAKNSLFKDRKQE